MKKKKYIISGIILQVKPFITHPWIHFHPFIFLRKLQFLSNKFILLIS